jgi:hypothetical protein
MKADTLDRMLSNMDEQIIRTLLYYDIFNYPLTAAEVFRFLRVNHVNESIVTSRLNNLTEQHIIFQFDNFFSLKNSKAAIDRRVKGNLEAEKYLPLAQKKAKLISRFPFVRAVLASGSLSKGYMDEKSDLDFFIITAPRRLWIARTLLVMYKRIFLFNSHKYFCVNYFVDEDHLEIEEKNLFTATELATAIPLYGAKHYEKLLQVNSWIKEFFPNYTPRNSSAVKVSKSSLTKRLLEKVLNLFFANTLESYFQHKTLSRWKRLYQKNYSATDFKVAFKSKSYASKNHDRNFQRKIMDLYEEKLKLTSMSVNFPLAKNSGHRSPLLKEESVSNSNSRA